MSVETTKKVNYTLKTYTESTVTLIHHILGELACAEYFMGNLYVSVVPTEQIEHVIYDAVNAFSIDIDFNAWPNFLLFKEALLFVNETDFNEWGNNHIWNEKFDEWRKKR